VHLSSLLEIAADAMGDRVAVGACDGGDLTYQDLLGRASAASRHLSQRGDERLVAVDVKPCPSGSLLPHWRAFPTSR
jgi:hypothetical protein